VIRRREVTCRRCGAPIAWATVEKTGKKIPLDFTPGRGNIVRVGDLAIVLRRAEAERRMRAGVRLYHAHFATCRSRRAVAEARPRNVVPFTNQRALFGR
jgi:hypothetical protein